MAGGLTISTLNDSSGVLATQNGMSGIAKAWVSFDSSVTTPTIRGAFNVSSVTRNGTGIWTINFTTAMPDANYSWVGNVVTGTGSFGMSVMGYGTAVYSTTACQICQKAGNGNSTFDGNYINFAVNR